MSREPLEKEAHPDRAPLVSGRCATLHELRPGYGELRISGIDDGLAAPNGSHDAAAARSLDAVPELALLADELDEVGRSFARHYLTVGIG